MQLFFTTKRCLNGKLGSWSTSPDATAEEELQSVIQDNFEQVCFSNLTTHHLDWLLCVEKYMHAAQIGKHPKNWETALLGKERLY